MLHFGNRGDLAASKSLKNKKLDAWDGRESNPDVLSDCRFSHHYGFRHRLSRLWSGLCLDHMSEVSRRPRPSSLYTFSAIAKLGSALSRLFQDREFTDFERIPQHVSVCCGSTVVVKSAVSTDSTTIPPSFDCARNAGSAQDDMLPFDCAPSTARFALRSG
jgi:hypothetical protein